MPVFPEAVSYQGVRSIRVNECSYGVRSFSPGRDKGRLALCLSRDVPRCEADHTPGALSDVQESESDCVGRRGVHGDAIDVAATTAQRFLECSALYGWCELRPYPSLPFQRNFPWRGRTPSAPPHSLHPSRTLLPLCVAASPRLPGLPRPPPPPHFHIVRARMESVSFCPADTQMTIAWKVVCVRAYFLWKLYLEELRCPLCGRSSSGLVAMQEHFQANHQMNLAPEMVQDIIKGASEIISGRNVPAVAAAAELQQHLTARNQFSCAKCPQTFGDQVSLELHSMHCHPVILHGLENPESAGETIHKVESLYPQCGDRTPSVEDEEKYHTESRGWTNVVAKSVNGSGSGDGKREVFECPVLCCPRRYHNPVILNKHVDVIHQWRLKFSPKGGVNKPHGAFRKVIRKRKPYICLFEGCSCRFWTRADRHQHILSHLFEADAKDEGNATGIPESEVKLTNGDAVGVKRGLVLRKMESESAKREQEHNSHTTSPSSPDSDGMPEGYGRPSVTSKPYTMQTFLMRERASESSPTSTSDSTTAFNEMIAYLPVRSTVHERIRVDVELVPLTQQNSRIVHL